MVDTAPDQPRWLPAVVTGTLPPFAVPLGALSSGLLADRAPAPRTLGLTLACTALALVAVALLACPETRTREPGALRSLRPRVLVPAGAGRVVLTVGTVMLATWSVGGFYQAFGPAMATDRLGAGDSLTIALVFASLVLLSPVGGPLAGRLSATAALRGGLVVFVGGYAGALVALGAGDLTAFVSLSLVAGIGNGAAASGAMRLLLGAAHPEQRAGTLATSYLMSYTCAAVPGLIAGQLSAVLDVGELATAYGVLAAVTTAIALVLVGTIRQDPFPIPLARP